MINRKSLIDITIQKECPNFKIINDTLYTKDNYYISMKELTKNGYRITQKGKLMRKITRGNGRVIRYDDCPTLKYKLEKLQKVVNSEKIEYFGNQSNGEWMTKRII